MWVFCPLDFHKIAAEGGCFLVLQRFSASASVWDTHFLSHRIHGSMLEAPGCVCECMYRPLFFQQEIIESNEQQNASRAIVRTRLTD